jgi:hypothetical protein
MSEKQTENSKIRDYLLGNLSSTNEEFEEKLMTDDTFFQEFQIQEEELIQDFVDDNLTDSENQKFENHFLISKERQEKVKFAQSLRKHVDQKTNESIIQNEITQETSEKNLSFFSFSFLQKAVPAFAIVLIVFGFVWFIFLSSGDDLSPLEKEFTKLNAGDLSNPEKFTNSLSLISGNPRSSSEIEKISKGKLVDRVLFRLALPAQTDSTKNFEIQLLKDQKVIFTQNEIRSYNNESGKELRLLIPAAILEKGTYQIRAKRPDKKNSRFSYTFLVE